MSDRNYDDTGSLWYGMSQLPLVNTFIFDTDGGPLPLRTQYVEAAAARFNALYGVAYDDTGARAYAAFVVPAPTPKIRFDPGGVDVLPLLGYVDRQAQIFSLLRGQAYSDIGAEAYAAFVATAPTPKIQANADGGLLPLGAQYVEAVAQRRAVMTGTAYDDTGARWYAAITLPVTPNNYFFGADGGMMPQDSLGTVARLNRFGPFYNVTTFNRPPIFYGLVLIPNIFFVEGNEFISDLNTCINYLNYDLQILNIARSSFVPLFTDLHPNGFADTLNVLVKLFNVIPQPMGITPNNKLKQFLSVEGSELTLAVNTLIDEMNVFIQPLKNYS